MRVTRGREAVKLLLKELESQLRGLTIAEVLDSKQEFTLANLPMPPMSASSPYEFAVKYSEKTILSKWKGLTTGVNTRRVALENWVSFERQCKETNLLFRSFRGFNDPTQSSFISKVQRKIEMVLGNEVCFEQVFAESRWSQGATFATKRGCSIPDKMTRSIATTRRAFPHLMRKIREDRAWMESLARPTNVFRASCDGPFSLLPNAFTFVKGNRSIVVPKNAKTGRTISAEPAGNAYLQQGVGRFIRKRLKRFGVDLGDQSHNQSLAARAEKDGLSTLDLKGASDTLSIELVYQLLPLNWALLLDDLRSPETYLKGSWHRLSKFSSMGNAFTFELESLIFWAICSTVCCTTDRNLVSVYGDDLVVPSSHAQLVIEHLEYCGFVINTDKSFTSGPFYESCGKHFFQGEDVTPVYQQELVDDDSELIRLTNRIVRWTYRLRNLTGSDPKQLARVARRILQKGETLYSKTNEGRTVPRVPSDCESDGGFLAHPSLLGKWSRNHGMKCRVLVQESESGPDDELPAYAYKLSRLGRDKETVFDEAPVLNSNPEGYVEFLFKPRWVYTDVYIHTWLESIAD